MQYLPLLASTLFFLLVIYCWNRFVVVNLIKMVSKRSQQFTPTKTEKAGFDFIIQKEEKIIQGLQLFFWIGGLLCIVFLIIQEV